MCTVLFSLRNVTSIRSTLESGAMWSLVSITGLSHVSLRRILVQPRLVLRSIFHPKNGIALICRRNPPVSLINLGFPVPGVGRRAPQSDLL